jgi:hypothetical protein
MAPEVLVTSPRGRRATACRRHGDRRVRANMWAGKGRQTGPGVAPVNGRPSCSAVTTAVVVPPHSSCNRDPTPAHDRSSDDAGDSAALSIKAARYRSCFRAERQQRCCFDSVTISSTIPDRSCARPSWRCDSSLPFLCGHTDDPLRSVLLFDSLRSFSLSLFPPRALNSRRQPLQPG